MNKLIVAIAIAAGIGCGIKGPPLPPIETVSDRANNANLDEKPVTAAVPVSGDATKKDDTKKVKTK